MWHHVDDKLPELKITPHSTNHYFKTSKRFPVRISREENGELINGFYVGYLCYSKDTKDKWWQVEGCVGYKVVYWYELPNLRVKLK